MAAFHAQSVPAPAQILSHGVETEEGETRTVMTQETVAARAPSSSPMKKPSGSAAAKQASSARPGFQPSAVAQFTAIRLRPAASAGSATVHGGRSYRWIHEYIAGGDAMTPPSPRGLKSGVLSRATDRTRRKSPSRHAMSPLLRRLRCRGRLYSLDRMSRVST